jgi:hypothetical protein
MACDPLSAAGGAWLAGVSRASVGTMAPGAGTRDRLTLKNFQKGGEMFDLNVQFVRQTFEFDCWYASLRMLVKYRRGLNAEPVGHPEAELQGMLRDSQRTVVKEDARRQGIAVGSYGVRRQLQQRPPRGLAQAEFQELAGYNGLVAPNLPPPYVPPPDGAVGGTGGFTSNQLESLMRIHGPLWCAFGYGHIVVAKGVDAQGDVLVHDPQAAANTVYPIANFNRLLTWQPNCVMFLPAIPNARAFT